MEIYPSGQVNVRMELHEPSGAPALPPIEKLAEREKFSS